MSVLNTFSLKGKIALVTGGAGLYGRQIVEALAEAGAKTFIASRGIEALEAVAQKLRDRGYDVTAMHLDLSLDASIEKVHDDIIKKCGTCDILVNNAVTRSAHDGWAHDLDAYDISLHVNASALFKITYLFAQNMKAQKSGSIINISSSAGLRGSGGAFAYGASKWAVRGMTKSAAQELSPHGIRVNSIHPGIIETAMVDEFSRKGINENVRQQIPMGHYADASEVANLALFLASDESTYCSGSEFVVDGGMTA